MHCYGFVKCGVAIVSAISNQLSTISFEHKNIHNFAP